MNPLAPCRPSTTPYRDILLVVDSLQIGGAERHVVDLAIGLRRLGHRPVVACSGDGPLRGPLEQTSIPVWVVGRGARKRRFSAAYSGHIYRLLATGSFDLVHAHSYASVVAATVAARAAGIPLVLTQHSEESWQTGLQRRVIAAACRRADHIIAVSRPIEIRAVQQLLVDPARVTRIPNGLDPRLPAAGSSPPSPEIRVGVVARLRPEKGVIHFLRMAALLAPLQPTCQFLVAGDGPLRPELDTACRRLGLSERVRFLGELSDARDFIWTLDLLVLPSLSEGSPLVTLEAMSLGVPILATTVGGVPEQIGDGREGLLVPAGDAAALAAAGLRLLRNPDLRLRLADAARRRVLSRFTHHDMVAEIMTVYRSALEARRAPASVKRLSFTRGRPSAQPDSSST